MTFLNGGAILCAIHCLEKTAVPACRESVNQGVCRAAQTPEVWSVVAARGLAADYAYYYACLQPGLRALGDR